MNKMSSAEITMSDMREIHESFNRHDVEKIVGFFKDDGVFRLARGAGPQGRSLRSKTEIRAFLTDRFSKIGDMNWETVSEFCCGNRAVSEWMVTGTLPDGQKLEMLGCDIYTFEGKKIVLKDTFWKSTEKPL
ncbi:MAG: nuclear transport factor 2 family protein [Dongiaceae bacterium]